MNDTISNNYARYPTYAASTPSGNDKGSRGADENNQDSSAHNRGGANPPSTDKARGGSALRTIANPGAPRPDMDNLCVKDADPVMQASNGAEVTHRVTTNRSGPPETDSPLAALGAHSQSPVDVEQTQDASAVGAVDDEPVDLDAVRDALTQVLNDPEQFNRILASVIDDTQHA